MKSVVALAIGAAIGLSCDFDVAVYMDPDCSFFLQTKNYLDQTPGQCNSGNNADYPYYRFSCSGDSITLTYFKGAGCSGDSATENYKLGVCGQSAVNGGVYVKASSNDVPGCCSALNHPLDPDQAPPQSESSSDSDSEERYGHKGEEPKHPEEGRPKEPLGHRGEKPHGFDPRREFEKLLHMMKHENDESSSRKMSSSDDDHEGRYGHEGEEPQHHGKPLGHKGEEPRVKNPMGMMQHMKDVLLRKMGKRKSESSSDSDSASDSESESGEDKQRLGHKGDEPGFPFPHMPGFNLKNRMMPDLMKHAHQGMKVKGTKENMRAQFQAAMRKGPNFQNIFKKNKLLEKLTKKEEEN